MSIEDALGSSGIDRLDAEILLAEVLRQTRTWLITHATDTIDQKQHTQFQELVERRKQHEPIAYIVGRKEFYGRTFTVNQSTLIPRPATEQLVEIACEMLHTGMRDAVISIDTGIVAWSHSLQPKTPSIVVDVGTGSGCIAVSLACEEPRMQIIATDVDTNALRIAKENAQVHGVSKQITFLQGDALEPLASCTEPFLLVSNPPYIPSREELMPDVARYEPAQALFGGTYGTDIIEEIMTQAKNHPFCVGWVLECRDDQIRKLA